MVALVLLLQFLHTTKVINSIYKNCWTKECLFACHGLSCILFSLFFLFYHIKMWETHNKYVDNCHSFWLCHIKTATCKHKHNYQTWSCVTGMIKIINRDWSMIQIWKQIIFWHEIFLIGYSNILIRLISCFYSNHIKLQETYNQGVNGLS